MNPTNLRARDYYPLLGRALLPRLRFHDLRHSAATLLLGANVNTKVVSEMLRHSHVAVTMDLYQHGTPTMQPAAAQALDSLLSGPVAAGLAVSGDSDIPRRPAVGS